MINEVNIGTYLEESRSRTDSRWDLTLGPSSVFLPSCCGFLCISPDPRVTLRVASLSRTCIHITNYIVLNQNEVCLSVTASHMQPTRTPKVTLHQPEPLRLPWINQNPWGYKHSAEPTSWTEYTHELHSEHLLLFWKNSPFLWWNMRTAGK